MTGHLDLDFISTGDWPSNMPAHFIADDSVYVARFVVGGTNIDEMVLANRVGDAGTLEPFGITNIINDNLYATLEAAQAALAKLDNGV